MTAARSRPDLEDWIADRCDELGIDIDFQTQADWLAEYEDAFGSPPPGGATAVPIAPPSPALVPIDEVQPCRKRRRQESPAVETRLAALQAIESAFTLAPKPQDKLSAWLTSDAARQLEAASVRGVPTPLPTLADVIDFAHEHGPRWWRYVPKLGKVRASRLLAWLAPVAERRVGTPAENVRLTRNGSDPAIRLSSTSPPPAGHVDLSRNACERAEALASEWLEQHQSSPHTYASYRLICRRFLDWCAGAELDAFALSKDDWRLYEAMLESPPRCQIRPARHLVTAETRSGLLRRGLRSSSIALNLRVIASFLRWADARSPAQVSMPPARTSRPDAGTTDRIGSQALHAVISECWSRLYQRSGPSNAGSTDQPHQRRLSAASLRRAKIVLDLAFYAGLRRSDFVTVDESPERQAEDLRPGWKIVVTGEGGEAHAPSGINQLLARHRSDALANDPSLVVIAGRSLVFPLRPAPRSGLRSAVAGQGRRTTVSLQAGSLYQSFKRFLRSCAKLLVEVDLTAAGQVERATIASIRGPAHRGLAFAKATSDSL